MITVKPVAFNKWAWNDETKQTEKHVEGYYPCYFLDDIQRNSAIQGYNLQPLYPSSEEAMKAYSEVGNRVCPDWYTKKEMAEWHPEDEIVDKP